jgi:hypothetical protein
MHRLGYQEVSAWSLGHRQAHESVLIADQRGGAEAEPGGKCHAFLCR